MKKSVLVGLLCLCMLGLNAQNELAGRVIDSKSQQTIPQASIKVMDSFTGSYSNQEGEFLIKSKKSQLIVEVSALGYLPKIDTISVQNQNIIKLISAPIQLSKVDILVLPVRAGENDPFSKSELNNREIKTINHGKDLPILLDQTPGTVVFSDAGNGVGYTGMRIRGSDVTRINVTFDGIPVNDAESQSVFWVNTPDISGSANSIQIQRGVGTSTNGGGAFGASINVNTFQQELKPYAELSANYGSFNTYKTSISAGTGLLAKRFLIDARATKLHSDGYIDRASSELHSLFASATYLGKKTTIRLNMFTGKEKTYQAWNGVPQNLVDSIPTYNESGTEKPGTPYANEIDNYRQDYYRLFLTHKLNDFMTLQAAGFLTRGKGYYEQYKGGVDYADYGLLPRVTGADTLYQTDLVRQLHLDNFFYGATYSFQYKKNRVDLKVGGAYLAYDGRHFGNVIWASNGIDSANHRYYYNPAFKNEANVYTKLNYRVGKNWYLFGDIQYRYVNYKVHGFRNNPSLFGDFKWHFVNPKLGLLYKINTSNLVYTSFAIGNKEPNRDDLEAGLTTIPKPETLYNLETGYEFRRGRFSTSINGYFMYYKNQLIQTGKINDVGAYTRINVPTSYRAGVEWQGSVRIHKMLSLGGHVAYSQNRIKEFTEFIDDYDQGGQMATQYKNSTIAFSPSWVGGFTLGIKPVKGLFIDFVGKGVSRQYLDNTQNLNRSLKGFFTADLRLRYEWPIKEWVQITFFGNVYNLTHTRYSPNGYTYGYIYGGARTDVNYVFPMAGIHFNGGVSIRFTAP